MGQFDHDVFCTSFCNHGHRLSDGKPIDHECYILPVRALKAEREGRFNEMLCIMEATRHKRRTHPGIKTKP